MVTTAADGDVFRGVFRSLIFTVEVVVELGDFLEPQEFRTGAYS